MFWKVGGPGYCLGPAFCPTRAAVVARAVLLSSLPCHFGSGMMIREIHHDARAVPGYLEKS